MSLFYQPGIPDGIHHLDPDESRHAVKVLRLKEGDSISVTDGKGKSYDAEIVKAGFPKCSFRILGAHAVLPNKFHRHIAIAPTKHADRIEWFVEKAVELGIDEISFFVSRNSERKVLNQERVEKIAISAMKQSGQVWLPVLRPLQSLKAMLQIESDQKFLGYVDSKNTVHLQQVVHPGGHCLVLIGPEGDFSPEELDQALGAGFQKVSLGTNRLRTETAGVAACHILNLVNS